MGYSETIRGLFKQGYKAFFKGNLSRFYSQMFHTFPLLITSFDATLNEDGISRLNPLFIFLGSYALLSISDFAANIFHVSENRYILQNNIAEFRGTNKIIQFSEILHEC
jgi:hypothetical protein